MIGMFIKNSPQFRGDRELARKIGVEMAKVENKLPDMGDIRVAPVGLVSTGRRKPTSKGILDGAIEDGIQCEEVDWQ